MRTSRLAERKLSQPGTLSHLDCVHLKAALCCTCVADSMLQCLVNLSCSLPLHFEVWCLQIPLHLALHGYANANFYQAQQQAKCKPCMVTACDFTFDTFCRALALRKNARVSELTLAAECARTDGESARAELERVRSRHDGEIQALEKRQKQLVSALRAVGAQSQPLGLADSSETRGPGPDQPLFGNGLGSNQDQTQMEQPSDYLIAVRDRNQTQAVQEAELTVAVMQVWPCSIWFVDRLHNTGQLMLLHDIPAACQGTHAQQFTSLRKQQAHFGPEYES